MFFAPYAKILAIAKKKKNNPNTTHKFKEPTLGLL